MKKMFLSVIVAAAFAVSSVVFAAGAFAAGGCGGYQTVSTPDPITTVDTDTSTSTSGQSQESG